MSTYGADTKPDLNVATETARVQAVMPFEKTNVTQWTYEDGVFVQMYNSRQGKSKLHIKFQKP